MENKLTKIMSEKKNNKVSKITTVVAEKKASKKTLLAKLRDLVELPLLLRRHY